MLYVTVINDVTITCNHTLEQQLAEFSRDSIQSTATLFHMAATLTSTYYDLCLQL